MAAFMAQTQTNRGQAQKPSVRPEWSSSVVEDPITATKSDVFRLKGIWVGPTPSFPYANAVPELTIACAAQSVQFTALDVNVLLDPTDSPIESRINDVQGLIKPRTKINAGAEALLLNIPDFIGILKSRTVVLRVRAQSSLLAMRFDMPDAAKVFSKCELLELEKREAATAAAIEERRLMGYIALADYEFQGFSLPVPKGSDISKGPDTLYVSAIATTDALHQFYDYSLRKAGWSPSNQQGNCWKKEGAVGGICVTYRENGVNIKYQP